MIPAEFSKSFIVNGKEYYRESAATPTPQEYEIYGANFEPLRVMFDSGEHGEPQGWGLYDCGYLIASYPTRREALAGRQRFIEWCRKA